MTILARVRDPELRARLSEAAEQLGARLVFAQDNAEAHIAREIAREHPSVVVLEPIHEIPLETLRSDARRSNAALLVAGHSTADAAAAVRAGADEWLLLPTTARDVEARIQTAIARSGVPSLRLENTARLIRYEEFLYDRRTGFPTLPVMIQRAREILEARGELTILYINFVWYEKIEETYGWQRLDDVLETTAAAVREFYINEYPAQQNVLMVSHVADDDFILFAELAGGDEARENQIRHISERLGGSLRDRVEAEHGEELAALCGIYVGAATVFRNPKIRTERLIYRGIREANRAARSAEEWERAGKIAHLKATIRDGAVFMEYHPIIVTATEEVYGFEALARGQRRELRSPEVLFEVAEEANMLWELSRLLRQRAVQGIINELKPDQYLFLNVDPHDFDDPAFLNLDPGELGIRDPSRIVLEITERSAITDYPRFQEYLTTFRERGFQFAVDDAGSGYAGLGSIANLAPDYIKLDISLISNIDTNFLKQNLVSTIVTFAESEGAKVIAEGVERREEFETVRELGVHLTQGFLFHRPRFVTAHEA
ncbi:MAG TPA: EAL domain-containing protein [Longimicrobiales bacterium]|nr:EAL domain-containing protein [Longimicrobiales bacterium]